MILFSRFDTQGVTQSEPNRCPLVSGASIPKSPSIPGRWRAVGHWAPALLPADRSPAGWPAALRF